MTTAQILATPVLPRHKYLLWRLVADYRAGRLSKKQMLRRVKVLEQIEEEMA